MLMLSARRKCEISGGGGGGGGTKNNSAIFPTFHVF